jgi:hypothetical protein
MGLTLGKVLKEVTDLTNMCYIWVLSHYGCQV